MHFIFNKFKRKLITYYILVTLTKKLNKVFHPTVSLPDNFKGIIIFLMVDAHDKHRGICTGGRDDNSLGTTLKVSLAQKSKGSDTGSAQ